VLSHDPAGGVHVVVVEDVPNRVGAAGGLAHAPLPVAVGVPVPAVVVGVAVRPRGVAEVAPRRGEPQRRATAGPELGLLPAPPHLSQYPAAVDVPRHRHLLHRHVHLHAVHATEVLERGTDHSLAALAAHPHLQIHRLHPRIGDDAEKPESCVISSVGFKCVRTAIDQCIRSARAPAATMACPGYARLCQESGGCRCNGGRRECSNNSKRRTGTRRRPRPPCARAAL
jgi:hypothetical protein